MSEIQSNYPRTNQIGNKPVDVPALQRIALSGLVWVVANWILFFAVFIVAAVIPRADAVGKTTALLWFGTYVGIAWCVALWVYRAHQAVCALRSVEPRMPSSLVAGLSVVPIVLFGVPLSYAMDFLIVRSESPNNPTMKWTSLWSRSGQVNVLAALLAAPSIGLLFCLLKRVPIETTYLIVFLETVSFSFAIVQGAALVFQINRRISNLVESRAMPSVQTTPPPIRDIHLAVPAKSTDG